MNAIFRGTEAETRDLLEAIRCNCDCNLVGTQPDGSCGAHQLMVDQRALDGLLFVRRDRLARLLDEEHNPQAEFITFERKGEANDAG